MKTYTQEEILKITNKLFTDNRENEGADDIDKNPYAAGVHDGILDVLTSLGIDCEEEFINWFEKLLPYLAAVFLCLKNNKNNCKKNAKILSSGKNSSIL